MVDPMSLAPIADTPGLWVNPDWQEGHAGTFAIVIGVSHSPHLNGAAADDLGLRFCLLELVEQRGIEPLTSALRNRRPRARAI